MKIMERPDHKVVAYENLGRTLLAVTSAPIDESTGVAAGVLAALKRLSALDQAMGNMLAEDRQPTAQRWNAVVNGGLEEVRAAVVQGRSTAEKQASEATRQRRSLLAWPELNPTASVRELRDAELRAAWPRVGEQHRTAMRAQMESGNDDEALAALARSPVPDIDREWARAIFAQRAAREHADELAGIDERLHEAREWAIPLLQGILNAAETGIQRVALTLQRMESPTAS